MASKYLSLILSLAIPIHVGATTLYVSPRGDDSSSGTHDEPLKTISAAAERAMPGDTVLVLEGVYRERVAPLRGGEPGKPIIYRGEPGKRVFVKGSELWTPEWKKEGDGIYSAYPDEALFDDRSDEYLDHHNPLKVHLSSTPWSRQGRREHERREAGDDRIGKADPRIVYTCGQVFVNGKRLLEVPLQEELEAETWWYDAATDRIWVNFGGSNPTEQQVELTTRRRIFAPHKRGLGHIVVEGFIFEHCGNQYPTNFWETDANAQKGAVGTEAGHHWTIRRNVVRHAKTFAIDAGNVDRHSKPNKVSDNLIESNYIVDNGSAGILSNGSNRMVIRHNVILRNNQLRFLGVKRWEQAGVKCHHFRNGLIERNYIANNFDTYGIWLDNQFPDSRVSKNLLYDNGRAGIFLEMSDYGFDRLLIDNNVILNNHENAVYIHDASGATFVHNLLANTQDSKGYGQAILIRQATARTKTYHHSFYGNLLVGNSRNVEVNYPAVRSGIQRFDSNAYGVERETLAFVVNDASDKPSPWSKEEFAQLVRSDLSESASRFILNDNDKAALTFAQWKTFWQSHGVENDRHSQLVPHGEVYYDPATHRLSISVGDVVEEIPSVRKYLVKTDLLDHPFPKDEPTAPGPILSLSKEATEFTIWSGLPTIEANQLPPMNWTLPLKKE